MKQLIYDVRFGNKAIKDLANGQIEELMDYNIPSDVWDICMAEISARRKENLERKT